MDLRLFVARRRMLQPDRPLLNDEQWQATEPLIPANKTSPGRKPIGGNRLFLEAMLYLIRTSLPRRDLPGHFGHWNSIYKRYARWAEKGVWKRVFVVLTEGKLDLNEAPLDITSVRAHQHVAGARNLALVAARPPRFTRSRKELGDLYIFDLPVVTSTTPHRGQNSSKRFRPRTSWATRHTTPMKLLRLSNKMAAMC